LKLSNVGFATARNVASRSLSIKIRIETLDFVKLESGLIQLPEVYPSK